jgi:hypothetical protein
LKVEIRKVSGQRGNSEEDSPSMVVLKMQELRAQQRVVKMNPSLWDDDIIHTLDELGWVNIGGGP